MSTKKPKGMCSRAIGAGMLAVIVGSAGCSSLGAYQAQHPENAHLIDLGLLGVKCADPLIASAINGTEWETLVAGILGCVAELVVAGTVKDSEQALVIDAAEKHLNVARDRIVKEAVVLRSRPLFPEAPKPAQ